MNELHLIADGALLIADGKILEIGPSRRVEKLAAAKTAVELDATGKVVIPGFVDCFTRLLCGPPLSDSPRAATAAVRNFTPQRMELEGRRRLRGFVRAGTTTLSAACGYGMDEQTELRALRVLNGLNDCPLWLTPWFYCPGECPVEFEGRSGEYLRWAGGRLLPEIRKRKLADEALVSSAFPESSLRDFADAARQLGMKVHRKSPGRIATEAGVSVLLPGETFHRAMAYPPGRALIDAGEPVALATGYDHLDSPSASMPMMMSLATKQMGLTAAEALAASTINAACAMGVDKWAGSFECGKQADILIFNAGDYREISHFFGMNLVALVIRAGQTIYPRLGQP